MTQAIALPQVRLRFAKRGDLRLVSHHDIMRCLERMVRRAKIPLATSQGFNPRPKIVFALALGLGIEALSEVVDFELTTPLDAEEVLHRLSATSPPGLVWLEARSLSPGESPPRPLSVSYQMDIPAERRTGAAKALARFLESSSWPYQRRRPDRTVSLDLRPFLLDAALTDQGQLRFRIKVTPEGTARGEEFVEVLGLNDLLDSGSVLVRSGIELAPSPARSQTNPPRRGAEPQNTSSSGNEDQSPVSIPVANAQPLNMTRIAAGPARALDGLGQGLPGSQGQRTGI